MKRYDAMARRGRGFHAKTLSRKGKRRRDLLLGGLLDRKRTCAEEFIFMEIEKKGKIVAAW
ncbi:MAG: hypothetical protein R6V10_13225 [bacterium]